MALRRPIRLEELEMRVSLAFQVRLFQAVGEISELETADRVQQLPVAKTLKHGVLLVAGEGHSAPSPAPDPARPARAGGCLVKGAVGACEALDKGGNAPTRLQGLDAAKPLT